MPIVNAESRGYFKIKGATSAFNFDFRDKVVLDIGSSTGGFTKYALDRGAKKVIAVEKGTNQMLPSLRQDPRVELHEKTDFFNVRISNGGAKIGYRGAFRATEAIDEASSVTTGASKEATREPILTPTIDIIMADVSFVSLKLILSHAKKISSKDTKYLVMLKPQFEAKPDQLNRGVVKNERIRRDIIKGFELWLKQNGFIIINKRDNSLKGKTGNLERFYYLALAK